MSFQLSPCLLHLATGPVLKTALTGSSSERWGGLEHVFPYQLAHDLHLLQSPPFGSPETNILSTQTIASNPPKGWTGPVYQPVQGRAGGWRPPLYIKAHSEALRGETTDGDICVFLQGHRPFWLAWKLMQMGRHLVVLNRAKEKFT